MIEQQGRVVEVLPARARIEIGPADGCARCASGKGCGAGLFVRLINRKTTQLLVDSSEPLQSGQSVTTLRPGQGVTIGIPESLFLRWVAQLYGLPLLAAFAIAVPVQLVAEDFALSPGQIDLAVLAAALLGFAGMLVMLRGRLRAGVSETSVQLLNNNASADSAGCIAGN